jgi:hypothetical protein
VKVVRSMDQDERCRVSQMTADPWWKPRIGEWSEMAMLVDRSVELSLDCVLKVAVAFFRFELAEIGR